MHVIWFIIIGSLIVGIRTEDILFCSGRSTLIDHNVSQLYFYKDPTSTKMPNVDVNVQCRCQVTLSEVASLVTLREVKHKTSCYDYVSVVSGTPQTEQQLRCSGTEIRFYEVSVFELILNEALHKSADSVLPVNVTIEPTQTSSLKVTCDKGESVLVPTTRSAYDSSTTSTSTLAAVNVTSTIEPRREANFTPLIVGVVAAGVIVGTCLVCVIVCRIKRQSNSRQERFHHTVQRKASSMLQSIKNRRPLPKVPKALKPKPSGVYNTIKPQSSRSSERPDAKSRSATDPSVYYLHPTYTSFDTPQTQQSTPMPHTSSTSPITKTLSTAHTQNVDRNVDNADGTYLTQVILSESGKHNIHRKQNNGGQNLAPDADQERTDNDMLKVNQNIDIVVDEERGNCVDTHDEENPYAYAGIYNENVPKSPKRTPSPLERQEALDVSMKRNVAEQPDDYMNMAGIVNSASTDYLIPVCKERIRVEDKTENETDSENHGIERATEAKDSFKSEDRIANDNKDVNTIDRHNHNGIDDTFPKLLTFKTVSNASSDAGEQVKVDEKPKTKRYVRGLDTTANGNSQA